MKAIITVIGKDTRGIIAGISTELANKDINILDISQTILQEYFTMIMLVDLEKMTDSYEQLKENLDKKSMELGVSVRIQHQDIFNVMHHI